MTTQAVSGRRYFTKAWLMEQKSLIALLVLIAIVSTMSPNFFTVNNLFNILQQTSVNAIMAVGMTLVIFDLRDSFVRRFPAGPHRRDRRFAGRD